MTIPASDISRNKTARIAGIAFLLALIIPVLSTVFVYSRLTVPGNAAATANNILTNEFLFRIGIASDLIVVIIGIVLVLALYILLKSVNRNLALLAVFLKLVAGVLITVIVLGNFFALLILTGQTSLTVVEPEQIQALAGIFFNMRFSLYAIPMIFTGLGFMVFFSLFSSSKNIPKILSGFGILSYVLIFLYALITIFSPNYASSLIIQVICWAPSCIFELIIGMWLLMKGVNVQQGDDHVPASF
jgi:hypothetical protein